MRHLFMGRRVPEPLRIHAKYVAAFLIIAIFALAIGGSYAREPDDVIHVEASHMDIVPMNIPPGYTIDTRENQYVTVPAFTSLGLGQVWTDKSVIYNRDGFGNPDGTVNVTLYLWGRPYNAQGSLLGSNQHVTITDKIGEFHLEGGSASLPPDSILGSALTWHIHQDSFTDPTEPFRITYTLYLNETPSTWRTNYWYSTEGALAEIRFEPSSENPYYWTKVESVQYAFVTENLSWNNGGGMNSGAIIDNLLGITFRFGSNNSPEDQTAASVRNIERYWADVRVGDTVFRWHLQWTKGTPKVYIITIRDFEKTEDGAWLDLVYEMTLGGPGGNEATPGSRTITSTEHFRRTHPEGNPDKPFEWEDGNLVYRMNVIAQVLLEYPQIPRGTLHIAKALDGHYRDWGMCPYTPFTARLRNALGEYLMLEEVGLNQFAFSGFTGLQTNATAIPFSEAEPVVIHNLPTHRDGAAFVANTPLRYYIEEIFLCETVATFYKRGLISVTYSITVGASAPENRNYFTLASLADTKVTIRNDFAHGIGFLEVFKILDGFPGDFNVYETCSFYVRIWDVGAENYLLFDPLPIDDPGDPLFDGSFWRVGNHVTGLTGDYPDMIPTMELPLSFISWLRLSNLWSQGRYEVREVRRVEPADEAAMNAAWAANWDDPLWVQANWLYGYWEDVPEIVSDTAWYADEYWTWGVIYSDSNGLDRLELGETISVVVTNRYKYSAGHLTISKELAGPAVHLGVDEHSLFFAEVRVPQTGKRLVFVPVEEAFLRNDTFRVIGYIDQYGVYHGYYSDTGYVKPPHAVTVVPFSVNVPALLRDLPGQPFADTYYFIVEEVFPDVKPYGLVAIEHFMEDGSAMPTDGFPMIHYETTRLTVRNTFGRASLVEFHFYKHNHEGQPLEGAVFHLYRQTAASWNLIQSVTTDSALAVELLLSPDGVYRLLEYKAPAPYQTPSGYWTLAVDAAGEILIDSQGGNPDFEDCGQILVNRLYPDAIFRFRKTDDPDNAPDGRLLDGAEFFLYYWDPALAGGNGDWAPTGTTAISGMALDGTATAGLVEIPLPDDWHVLDDNDQPPRFKLREIPPDYFMTPPGYWIITPLFCYVHQRLDFAIARGPDPSVYYPDTPAFEYLPYAGASGAAATEEIDGGIAPTMSSHARFALPEVLPAAGRLPQHLSNDDSDLAPPEPGTWFLGNRLLTVPFHFHKTSHLLYTALSPESNGPVCWNAVNDFLLEGAAFSLFQFNGPGSPPPYPYELITDALIGDGPAQWTRIWYGTSSGNPGAPMELLLSRKHRYYQLVETMPPPADDAIAPNGFDLPWGQWRLTLCDNAAEIADCERVWYPMLGGIYVNIHWVGDPSVPAFARNTDSCSCDDFCPCHCEDGPCDESCACTRGHFFVGNRPTLVLPLMGGGGSLPFTLAGLSVLLLAMGTVVYQQLKRHTLPLARGRMRR